MKYILGKKLHMLEYFTENGFSVPATLVHAGPITVTQVKSTDTKDGYNAVLVGYESAPEKALTRAEIGQTKDLGMFRYMKEFRMTDALPEKGAVLDVTSFAKGDIVAVTGTSKVKVSRVWSNAMDSTEDAVHTVRNTLNVSRVLLVEVCAHAYQVVRAWRDAWVLTASLFAI
jgi:hypothetical protein